MGKRRSRGKRGGLRALIRSGYRALGILNTASHVASGDPGRIVKHLLRRKTVKFGGSLIRK